MKLWIRGTLLALLATAALGSCGGCSTAELEDDAARRTHQVIAPAYQGYVEADVQLEEAQLELEHRWLARWAKAVEEADRGEERQVHTHIAPRYVSYVEADQKLDDDQKARRKRHVQAWCLRLEEVR